MDAVYRAISDPTRRAILDRLSAADRSVKELTQAFPITQQGVSHHLRILRAARLVASRRISRENRYRLTPAPLRSVMQWVDHYRRFVDPAGHHWALLPAARRQALRKERR